jgi:septal ring factor EnvC (AmiA/AmiB activator)
VEAVNAQEIYDELRADIKEMKSTLKELAMATTTLALQSQRLDNVENRVAKMETSHDDVWEAVKEIQSTCRVRERVYNYGLRHMESPSMSRENWLNVFIGSAVRNGIWIVLTAVIMALVGRWV